MPNEPIFNRPEFEQNQANGFASANERFLVTNALTAMHIIATQASPPGVFVDGDTYLVSGTPAGDWSTFAQDDVAIASGGGWIAVPPRGGMAGEVTSFDGAWIFYSEEESAWVFDYETWSTVELSMRGRFPGDVPRFTKAFEILTLANAGTDQTAHGITGLQLNEYMAIEGVAYDGSANAYALPFNDGTNALTLRVTATNVELVSNFDATGWNARVRLIYAKA